MSLSIQTNQLTKSYGRSRGIIDVIFGIQEGEVFGFLGPNGAGKTTTMRVLMGLLHANSGRATIGGRSSSRDDTQGALGHSLDTLPKTVMLPSAAILRIR